MIWWINPFLMMMRLYWRGRKSSTADSHFHWTPIGWFGFRSIFSLHKRPKPFHNRYKCNIPLILLPSPQLWTSDSANNFLGLQKLLLRHDLPRQSNTVYFSCTWCKNLILFAWWWIAGYHLRNHPRWWGFLDFHLPGRHQGHGRLGQIGKSSRAFWTCFLAYLFWKSWTF